MLPALAVAGAVNEVATSAIPVTLVVLLAALLAELDSAVDVAIALLTFTVPDAGAVYVKVMFNV